MNNQDIKELIRQFYEAVNQGDLEAVDRYISPDFVEHEEAFPGTLPGIDGVKAFIAIMRSAFPDMQVLIEDIVAEENKLAVRSTWRGTHSGEFLGIPTTGRQVVFSSIDIIRYESGLALEHWGVTDVFSLMQQLGVIAPPGQ